jgi:hypothetical protein
VKRGLALVAVLGIVVSLGACRGGGSSDSAGSSSTTTSATPTTVTGGTCEAFHGVTTMLTSSGPVSPSFLVDATAEAVDCLDRVTFTFDSATGVAPGYTVQYQDPSKDPFLDGDPPQPISLPGVAFLVVKIKPALSTNPLLPDAPQTYKGNLSLSYGDHHHLQIVRKLPDVDNTVTWVIGLDGPRPFVVDRAEDPPSVSVYIG